MPKMLKNKKEIESNGILLKFLISNISIFFQKNRSFAKLFDKFSDRYIKTTQKF